MSPSELLRSRIVDVPDFPTPGVVFKDISPLLADHDAFSAAVDAVVAHHVDHGGDKVVGVEVRFARVAVVAILEPADPPVDPPSGGPTGLEKPTPPKKPA